VALYLTRRDYDSMTDSLFSNTSVMRLGNHPYILAIIILLIVLSTRTVLEPFAPPNVSVDLVIARYKEDLKWLSEYKDHPFRRIIIYNKGPEMSCPPSKSPCSVRALPNVGLCDHTYLHHIVNADLADITVFLPASADLPHKKERLRKVIDLAMKGQPALFGANVGDLRKHEKSFQLSNWEVTAPSNKDGTSTLTPSADRPFGTWYDKYIKVECPYITYNGLFSLTKEMIWKHPPGYYKTLLDQVSQDKYPEAAHYIERAWGAMVYPFPTSVFHRITFDGYSSVQTDNWFSPVTYIYDKIKSMHLWITQPKK